MVVMSVLSFHHNNMLSTWEFIFTQILTGMCDQEWVLDSKRITNAQFEVNIDYMIWFLTLYDD